MLRLPRVRAIAGVLDTNDCDVRFGWSVAHSAHKKPRTDMAGLQVHSEEVSSESSLAESLSCAKECGRRPHGMLVAEPLKLIKPLQHPGRSRISRHRSRCIIECK